MSKIGGHCRQIALLALVLLAGHSAEAESIRSGNLLVTSVASGGQIVGCDVSAGGKLVAPLRLSSNGLITAGRVSVTGQTLRFEQLQPKSGIGLTLAPDDFVSVELQANDPLPQVRFRLTIKSFDRAAWEANAGKFPLHFLTCSMPNADVWHQRGWLMATPKADPFPLLLDQHVGTPEVVSQWSRNWSSSCPLGAHPIPVIGLWAPQDKLYVGYDFEEARLTDHSEKYIATVYCWQEGAYKQFIALSYPYGGQLYGQLQFPQGGETIASHFRLLYATDLDDMKDPNLLWQDLLFARYGDQLPRVPRMNDMSWMPGGTRLADFAGGGTPSLVNRMGPKGDTFEEPGTVTVEGWTWHRELAVETAYERQRRAEQAAGQEYVPLFSVVDAEGHSQGDAAAAFRLTDGEAQGGRLLYVWYGILGQPQVGPTVIRDALAYLQKATGLDQLPEAQRWAKVAVLPGDVPGPTLDFLKQAGLWDKLTHLTPPQLVEEGMLTPQRFPVVLNLGAEAYYKTVNEPDDAKRALIKYLRSGGTLGLLGRGPHPFYEGIEGGKATPDPLLTSLGVQFNSFEQPPTQLFIVTDKGQQALNLTALPDKFDFPVGIEPRLRAISRGGKDSLSQLRADLEYLLPRAKRVTIAGDECLFWEKPIEGKWWDRWGGEPVRTLHNTNGWAVGMALVDLYRHERDPKLLPYIDGVYNWTKHFVWTRNEFADVPSSPFAIGGTLSTAFLLDYHFTFGTDPQRASRAQAAPELARAILYRYLPVWTTDNDDDDNLDPNFLMEPNSGRDWAGLACANEVHWMLDSMTQVFVHTGDRRLAYYLRGALQRWPQLYRERYGKSLEDYGHDALTEGLGFFDGCGPGRGGRYNYGTADILPLNYPVGDSLVRVVCGEKGAFACDREGVHTDIADYRCAVGAAPETGGIGGFSFRLASTLGHPFDISLSFPFVNIARMPVAVMRGGQRRELRTGEELRFPPQSPSSVYVRGLQDGDVVVVGTVAANAAVLPADSGMEYGAGKPEPRQDGQFQMIDLPAGAPVRQDWNDTASFAGLPAGKHYAFKVPYLLAAAPATGAPLALDKRVDLRAPISGAAEAFMLFSAADDRAKVDLILDDGARIAAPVTQAAMAWKAWPPIFTQRLWLAGVTIPAGRKIAAVEPVGGLLFGLTVWRGQPQEFAPVQACLEKGVGVSQKERAREAKLAALRSAFAGVDWSRAALLPPDAGGTAATWAGQLGLLTQMQKLSPDDFVDPAKFNAQRFPVALYLGAETYLRSVKKPDDGRQAIVDYLRGGGLLVCLGSGPFPFFYGGAENANNATPLLPQLGVPLVNAFEKSPGDLVMTINREQQLLDLKALPGTVPFPQAGDLRLRSIDPTKLSAATKYVPLVSVAGKDGKSYGDAAAYVELHDGDAAGGKVLYVWFRLEDDPEVGQTLLEQVFTRLKQVLSQ